MSNYSKAIAALLAALAQLGAIYGLGEPPAGYIDALSIALGPILVYAFPANKPKS